MIKAVLFDWDGTLLNSMPEEYKGCAAVFKAAGLEPPGVQYFCQSLTMPFQGWFARHGVKMPYDKLQTIYHGTIDKSRATLFPGVRESFQAMRKAELKLGIVSARGWPGLLRALEQHELMGFLEVAVGQAEEKAQALINTCDDMRLAPRQVIYVGDLASDILAGKQAGVKTIGFLGEFGDPSTFSDVRPDFLAASHAELQQVVLGLLQPNAIVLAAS